MTRRPGIAEKASGTISRGSMGGLRKSAIRTLRGKMDSISTLISGGRTEGALGEKALRGRKKYAGL